MSLFVLFLYTVVSILVPLHINKISWNDSLFWFFNSCMSWIFLWKEFNQAKTCSTQPFFTNTNVSSTYLLQWEMLPVTIDIIFVSNSAIKMPARTGPNGEPKATPSFCWYISPPNHKWTFLVHSNNKLCMSFLPIEVSISFQWYILSKATLIVSSRGTLVNRDFTSNDIILNPWGTFTLCIFWMKSLVLLNVYWDWLKGTKVLLKILPVGKWQFLY